MTVTIRYGAICVAFGSLCICNADEYQYEFEELRVAAARADEPLRPGFSASLAAEYLERGEIAWTGSQQCVSCHTNGTYITVRPALSRWLGPPRADVRKFFEESLPEFLQSDREQIEAVDVGPAQLIYIAAGLAEWDAHIEGKLSAATNSALRHMLRTQRPNGTWNPSTCWPPYEADAFHLATVAATAIGTAPGWLENLQDAELQAALDRLTQYLQNTPPPHDFGRVLLLRASYALPNLLTPSQRQEIVELILQRQQADGGWSIRSFAEPQQWGDGSRAEKLRAEPEFDKPPSDGHQTGLALLALYDAGIPASDPRVRRGIDWLLNNQRQSGRWWTRSLNNDRFHFITYSGTALPLLALARYGELPQLNP